MTLDFSVILDNWQLFASGLWMTLVVALLSIAAGFLLAIPVAIMALSHRRWLRTIAGAYVEWFRNIPFIVVLYIFFYGLPSWGCACPSRWSAASPWPSMPAPISRR